MINIIFASVDNVFDTEHPDEVLKQFQTHSAELDSESLVPRLAYAVIYLLIVMILALGVAKVCLEIQVFKESNYFKIL